MEEKHFSELIKNLTPRERIIVCLRVMHLLEKETVFISRNDLVKAMKEIFPYILQEINFSHYLSVLIQKEGMIKETRFGSNGYKQYTLTKKAEKQIGKDLKLSEIIQKIILEEKKENESKRDSELTEKAYLQKRNDETEGKIGKNENFGTETETDNFNDKTSEILNLLHKLLLQQTNTYGRLKNIEFEIEGLGNSLQNILGFLKNFEAFEFIELKEGQKRIIGSVRNTESAILIVIRKLLEEIKNARNEIKNRLNNIKQVEEIQKETEELKKDLREALNDIESNLNNH